MSTVKVKIEIDVDELRHWAGKHADAGHHGVAHVLYKAAEGVESLTEQALREAREERVPEPLPVVARKPSPLPPPPPLPAETYLTIRLDDNTASIRPAHVTIQEKP